MMAGSRWLPHRCSLAKSGMAWLLHLTTVSSACLILANLLCMVKLYAPRESVAWCIYPVLCMVEVIGWVELNATKVQAYLLKISNCAKCSIQSPCMTHAIIILTGYIINIFLESQLITRPIVYNNQGKLQICRISIGIVGFWGGMKILIRRPLPSHGL